MKFERLDSLPNHVLMDLLPGHLNQIDPNLRILAEKLSLSKEDKPFMLVTRTGEKRIGMIEVLDDGTELPGKVLAHADWIAANRTAISNLKNEPIDLDLLPFVIGLVRKSPAWLPLCSYLKIDVSLIKYLPLSFQGSIALLLEPLGEAPKTRQRPEPPSSSPRPEKTMSRFTAPETVNDMGLTETEIRFFTS